MTTGTKFTVGEYKTRDGRRARVYATDGAYEYKLHGALETDAGWCITSWMEDGRGRIDEPHNADLMPPLREWWLYAGISINSKDHADRLRKSQPDAEIIHVREVPDDQA